MLLYVLAHLILTTELRGGGLLLLKEETEAEKGYVLGGLARRLATGLATRQQRSQTSVRTGADAWRFFLYSVIFEEITVYIN